MTHSDPDSTGDGERDALATLLARFQADRDMLAAGVQHAEAVVCDLASRLDALAARVGAGAPATEVGTLRSEMGRLASTVAPLRGEVAHMAEALGVTRAELERRGRELETLRGTVDQLRERATVEQLREQLVRRAEETEARLGVRLDAIVAGAEAEARAVREALWDRVAGAERRLQDAETMLAERLASLEQARAARGGRGGVLECVRDEIVAAVMMVVSIGAVVGRLTLSLVR